MPGIINNKKNAPVSKSFSQSRTCCSNGFKSRPFSSYFLYEIGKNAKEVIWLLAQLNPKNTVEERILNICVMSKRFGECRFSIAASSFKGCGNANNSVLFFIKQAVFNCIKFTFSLNKVWWRFRSHHGNTLLLRWKLQGPDQGIAMSSNIEITHLAKPSR